MAALELVSIIQAAYYKRSFEILQSGGYETCLRVLYRRGDGTKL